MPTSHRYVGPKALTDKSLAVNEDVKRVGGGFRENTTKSISANTMTKLQFQATDDNTGITVITNDGFQVPVAGLYCVKFDVRIDQFASMYAAVAPSTHTDNTAYFQDHSGSRQDASVGGPIPLAANDILSCFIFVGVACSTIATRRSRFRVYRVGN